MANSQLDLIIEVDYWKGRFSAQVVENTKLRHQLLRLDQRFQEEPEVVAAYVDSEYKQRYDALKVTVQELYRKLSAIKELLK